MAGARTSTARRYAEAAFELAERDDKVEQWLDQLNRVSQVAADLRATSELEDPRIPIEQRLRSVKSALGTDAVPQLVNLVRLVLRRRRADSFDDIYREFRRLHNRRVGIVEATATSAAPLDDQELTALRTRLEDMTGKQVELSTSVDASLLGGIQVRLGDLLIDGSVRGRLERLRNRLASGALTP
jgi:F-type H+-transporting ATPase subunit delta